MSLQDFDDELTRFVLALRQNDARRLCGAGLLPRWAVKDIQEHELKVAKPG